MSAQCPGCGRFARSFRLSCYDGQWNQIYLTTYCAKCGEITETLV